MVSNLPDARRLSCAAAVGYHGGMEPLEQRAAAVLQNLLPRRGSSRLLVAASGGVDSMALLELLHRLSGDHLLKLVVGHFNHQLRGRQSGADERLVRTTARRMGLECVTGRGDVRQHARQQGVSIEMAARELRHAFLAEAARRHRATWVVLAHHADDQAETFFLNALRGCGGGAVAGMKADAPSPWGGGVRLLRPLLCETKAALIDYATVCGIRHREDASNGDPSMLRNRVRIHLIQPIARHLGAGAIRPLLQSMEIIGTEADCVMGMAKVWLESGRTATVFDALHPAVQRQVVRIQLIALGVEPAFDLIEKLRHAPGTKVSAGPDCVVFDASLGRVSKAVAGLPQFQGAALPVKLGRSGQVEFGALTIQWQRKRFDGSSQTAAFIPDREHFDADVIGRNVVLRHWQPGDRFQPTGMKQSVKLQDLLVNARIPAEQRRSLVVALAEDGRLFWVQGLRMSEPFKLTSSTRRVLVWAWARRD